MFKKLMTAFILINLLLLAGSISALAKPQPDFTFYGTAYVNGVPLTQSDTGYTITLVVDGVEIVRYTMGNTPDYEDYYVLIVPMDDDPAVTNKGQAGDTAYIYINGNPIDENPLTLGSYEATVSKDINATISISKPEIDVSPMSLSYGDVFIGSTSPLSVTITNTGTANLNVSSIALGGSTSADFAITAGPSNISLAPGAHVVVQVTYSPSGVGAASGTLVIQSNDSDESVVTVPLSGKGVAVPVPEIDVSPMALNYGDVYIGSCSNLTATIYNTGSADLEVSYIAFGAGSSGDYSITALPSTPAVIIPGANALVEVTYCPTDTGFDSGTLEIASTDSDEPLTTVSLSGNGIPVSVPEIDVSPTSINYGNVYVGSTPVGTITIHNIGSADLEVTGISLTGSANFIITAAPPTPAVIIPGASVEIKVTYVPTGIGSDNATVEIASTDADEPVVIILLSGNGIPVPVPEIDVSPMSLNYGDVYIGSCSNLTATIYNTGSADLEVSSIAFGARSSGDYSITALPSTPAVIIPGANALVEITYCPTDTGFDSGTLEIASTDSDEPIVIVSLSGNGIPVPGWVNIDIKPGSFPNSINLRSKGKVPVAILSSPIFDATTVDRSTVVFAGASPLPIGKSPEDVNSDGLLDVVLHFETKDLDLQPGDTEACLGGKTLNGQEFEGCDSVRIVK